VGVVCFVVFTFDRVSGHLKITDQRSSHVILGAKRVAATQNQVGTASDQGTRQVGRLGGNVQTTRHAGTLERFLRLKALPDGPQDGHFLLGPLDAVASLFSQGHIFYVVFFVAHVISSKRGSYCELRIA
jgi:hypothetical protein